ncbi:alpha/beta-hydrolase [Lentithecium fluviatile CBS 122367]|uniref:Alpha/beta-hydrolase n=1 Tax=Lentithecium fluviatile CBS 122367 TaxID=1168545 RepID=A0A6G1IS46_9PLEO|nr:alpha/beta-hydrolase [Lentithecium fluviatile CBS 122367]
MPVNTITVGAAVTPTVIETYISHYLNRRPLRQKPTAHISYHEGLELIRRFLHYASFHTVDELQAFTSQWVPVPVWVDAEQVQITKGTLMRSADHVRRQLGAAGVEAVGGNTWWEWRREGTTLKAEWIEMRKDMEQRKRSTNTKGQRIMLYVHGGAYFFGSVDEHRYQMQRHARKLKARVLAPRYRLAPQFPFPCGLMDCLAAYLFLLEHGHDPSTVILAGDSAGGGMVLSMLVTLRDQGIPLPAGAVLISPWVDLTHSFPSLGGDGKLDYIPAHGFIHKPSMSWPPPNADDLLAFERSPRASQEKAKSAPQRLPSRSKKEEKEAREEERTDRVRGYSVQSSDKPDISGLLKPPEDAKSTQDMWVSQDGKYSIGPKSTLSVQLEDTRIEIKDQIQLYTPNHMLTHPLVSPALQPSLGGLPPLLIQVGGGELLRDEQIYVAHKAAQPLAYFPPPSNHQTAETIQAEAVRHRPTNVQLQVWDDLCHVAPTLSFTRPAKHMYRSIAQFGAWALARAQKTSIDIMDDDSISIVSEDSSISSATTASDTDLSPEAIKLSMPQSALHVGFESIKVKDEKGARVGKAGDPLPAFDGHMIRQRIDRHGHIHSLPPPSELAALNMLSAEIGVPKPGPVNKWMKAQQQWNGKFAKQKLKVQKQRMKDMEKGYEGFDGETPPPTALAARRLKGMKKERKAKKSWGMALWSLWGSKHDEVTIDRESKADQSSEQSNPSSIVQQPNQPPADGTTDTKPSALATKPPPRPRRKSTKRPTHLSVLRSRSRHSSVTDEGQTSTDLDDIAQLAPPTPGMAETTVIAPERKASPLPSPNSGLDSHGLPTPNIVVWGDGEGGDARPQSPETLIPATDTFSTRPTRGGVAYPFRLKVDGMEGEDVNASTLTLQSITIATPNVEIFSEEDKGLGGGEVGSSDEKDRERPGVERFVTASVGELKGGGEVEGGGKAERPGVERFETAQEDFSMLANGKA